MANTTIQILRSFGSQAPNTLLDGQLAYSFVSNTLFIGSNTKIIAIADPHTKFIAQFAYLQANTGTVLAQAGYNTANSAQANTIYTQGVNDTQNTIITLAYFQANTGTVLAQAAFDKANTEGLDIDVITGINTYQNTLLIIK